MPCHPGSRSVFPTLQPPWPPFFRLAELQPAVSFSLCLCFFFPPLFLKFQLRCLSQRVLPWLVVTPHTYSVMLSCVHCLKLSRLHICSLIECLSPDPRLQVPLGQAPSLHEISVSRSLDQFWGQCVNSVKNLHWMKEGRREWPHLNAVLSSYQSVCGLHATVRGVCGNLNTLPFTY